MLLGVLSLSWGFFIGLTELVNAQAQNEDPHSNTLSFFLWSHDQVFTVIFSPLNLKLITLLHMDRLPSNNCSAIERFTDFTGLGDENVVDTPSSGLMHPLDIPQLSALPKHVRAVPFVPSVWIWNYAFAIRTFLL